MAERVRAAGHTCTVSSVQDAEPATVSRADAICVWELVQGRVRHVPTCHRGEPALANELYGAPTITLDDWFGTERDTQLDPGRGHSIRRNTPGGWEGG